MIRFAAPDDIPKIMQYIDEHWKKGHILAVDKEIFCHTYVYPGKDGEQEVCLVLYINDETGDIEGILGYMPYGLLTDGERDMFTALWKITAKGGFLLGTKLMTFLEREGQCRGLYCAGLVDDAVPLMKLMGKDIVDFEHYYIPNPELKPSGIAVIPESVYASLPETIAAANDDCTFSFRRVNAAEDIPTSFRPENGHLPHKSPAYIKHRYFEHPAYDYIVYHLKAGDEEGLLVFREQEAVGSRIIRIIDLIGSIGCMEYAGAVIKSLFSNPVNPGPGYEYCDCLVSGISPDLMEKAGFIKKQEGDGSIIPNYYEPFEQRNITIHNFLPKGKEAVIFRGDGDQDRPSFSKKRQGDGSTVLVNEPSNTHS